MDIVKLLTSTRHSSRKNFLQLLPLEIRNQIYKEVLGPTGYIYLQPSIPHVALDVLSDATFVVFASHPYGYTLEPPPVINLCFMRTNKQIYYEARDTFFRRNLLNVEECCKVWMGRDWPFTLRGFLTNLPFSLRRQIQGVHFDLDYLCPSGDMDDDGLLRTRHPFRMLSRLAAHLSLQIVQMNIRFQRNVSRVPAMSVDDLRLLLDIRKRPTFDPTYPPTMYKDYLDLLKHLKSIELRSVKRRIVFDFPDMKALHLSRSQKVTARFVPIDGYASSKRNELVLFDRDGVEAYVDIGDVFREGDGDPNPLFKDIHEACGGELYLGSRLCFKDGVEVSGPFQEITVPWQDNVADDTFSGDKETFHIMLRGC